MRDLRRASITSVLALGLACAAVPAVAQSSSSGSPAGSTSSPGASSTTGTLPDNSLAGQRQGAIGGGSVSQGGAGSTESPQQSKPGSGQ